MPACDWLRHAKDAAAALTAAAAAAAAAALAFVEHEAPGAGCKEAGEAAAQHEPAAAAEMAALQAPDTDPAGTHPAAARHAAAGEVAGKAGLAVAVARHNPAVVVPAAGGTWLVQGLYL